MRLIPVLLALAAVFSFPSFAQDVTGKALSLSAVTEQQAQIRADLLAGRGRYKDMSELKKGELLSKQAELLAIIDGKQSSDDLTSAERVDAFNKLEWIEAAVNNAENERMVCAYERTIGSNRKTRVCKTVAQITREREEARRRIDNNLDVYGTK